MSQVFDLCEGDDNGEWPNAASVPPLPLLRKRPRDKEESSNDAYRRNYKGPGNRTATGWAEFVFDLELADEVEVGVSPHKKRRRSIMKSERSAKNDAAGNIAQNLKGFQSTEKDVGSVDAQVVDHDESYEGIAAAASHPMTLDSQQTSRDDGSANKHPLSRRAPNGSAWEDRLSQLADYQKVHGHCNAPQKCSENAKLGTWVTRQRSQYSLHRKGETSSITLSRIQALESLGFEWRDRRATWEDRLSELADYCKVHGHCNVPTKYSENAELGRWVTRQRCQYRLHQEGKTSQITLSRREALESLGFRWDSRGATYTWEDRLSELADFCKVHGHCNVPSFYSKNAKLGRWVANQKYQHSLHRKGESSSITHPRIQALESLGFEWRGRRATWEDRLSELADYCKVHGHCNVPTKYSENAELGRWVTRQREQHSLHMKGKTSQITIPRIQALESLGFEWGSASAATWEDRLSELADYRKVHGRCNVPGKYSENAELGRWVTRQKCQHSLHLRGKTSQITLSRIQALESLGFEWGSRGSTCTWEDRLSELVDFRKVHGHCNVRKVHGHCNVPQQYSENARLATWVTHQRSQYSLHQEGKTSPMTLPRIQALESLGFEWGSRGATYTWEDRLSELADYCKLHGNCNVHKSYSENAKLGRWVSNQRYQHSLHLKGETSTITLPRIKALERLGFEWKPSSSRRRGITKKA